MSLPQPIHIEADISKGTLTLRFNGDNPGQKVEQWVSHFGALRVAPELVAAAERLSAHYRRRRAKSTYALWATVDEIVTQVRGRS